MSTKRKTLKQKKLKDIRTSLTALSSHSHTELPSYSFSQTVKKTPIVQSTRTHTLTYNLSEIRISLIVSAALIILNTVIFLLLKNSIITLDIFGF